ncbi:glycosyltransferase [Vagococcus fluvialis]|uniref:glycosyltransferase n=1 Tax=Vagococcus fluvialis TaxID=2738 RepID=UPI0037D6D0A9
MSLEKKYKYAVGIILYNPSEENFDNLVNYTKKFNKIYIYDNSKDNNSKKIESILVDKNYTYFFNGLNEGISIPFNKMIQESKKENCDYFLMMDQDSYFNSQNIEFLVSEVERNTDNNSVLFCPNIFFNGTKKGEIEENASVEFCITSGSIVNVNVFIELKGYDENLFIDGVDRDFCIRVIENNFRIKKIKDSMMKQTLGDKNKNLLGIYEHSPLRNYYIYRNRLYVINKYPLKFNKLSKIKSLYLSQLKQIFSILFFEDKKVEKYNFIKKAKLDYKENRMGKIRGE